MNVHGRKTIKRIVITGGMDESREAFRYCERNGYEVIKFGPRRVDKYHVDTTRFRMVAEREVPKENSRKKT